MPSRIDSRDSFWACNAWLAVDGVAHNVDAVAVDFWGFIADGIGVEPHEAAGGQPAQPYGQHQQENDAEYEVGNGEDAER